MHRFLVMFVPALLFLLTSAAWAQGTILAPCDNCGIVKAIQLVEDRQQWTPLGAVAPGVGSATTGAEAGGATAMVQFAPKSENKGGMVVVGSAGGAAYAQRPNQYRRTRWEVTVAMEKGPPRVLTLSYEPLVQIGDRVSVMGNQVELFNP